MSRKHLVIITLMMMVFVLGIVPFGYTADMGRVRFAHFVFDGPPVDLMVDNMAVETNVVASEITGYVDVTAGKHEILVIPTGKTLDAAVVAPTAVMVESGQDYALALVGQAADKSIEPLVINETMALQRQDMKNESGIIMVNNLKGAPALDVALDDATITKNLSYGNFGTGLVKSGNYNQLSVVASGDPTTTFSPPFPPGEVFVEPGVVILAGMMGTAPGDFGSSYTMGYQSRTSLTVSQFLAGFSGRGIGYPKSLEGQVPFKPQIYSFDTLLAALDKANLKDIVDQGSYILFAPTDEAFAALPNGTLDKLMADPQALADLLRYHIAQGTLSATDLVTGKSLTTLENGQSIQVGMVGDSSEHMAFGINGNEAGCGCNYWAANNNRIFVIDTVLMPPSS